MRACAAGALLAACVQCLSAARPLIVFDTDPSGRHVRLLPKMPAGDLTRLIEDLMCAPPRRASSCCGGR